MENPYANQEPSKQMSTLLDVMLGVKPRSAALPNAPHRQFLQGDAAWVVGSKEELLDHLSSGDNPIGLTKSSAGTFFKRGALCFAGLFAIAMIASQLQYRTPEIVDSIFTMLFAVVFVMMCYYGIRLLLSLFTGPKWNTDKQLRKVSKHIGELWEQKLAVAFYRDNELTPATREVVDHMRLLYASAASHGLPLNPKQWRSLTDEAVQATDLYFATGDTTLAQIVRDRVDILVPYRSTW